MVTEIAQSSSLQRPKDSADRGPGHKFEHVRLLADDLTGACDAGAAFLAAGHGVRVWLGPRALYPAAESVQAFHTDSRHLSAIEAADAVTNAAQSLGRSAGTLLFKKVDSAGRGPIGAELLAAHRALGTKAILFAPAFPAMGRSVRDGVLSIRDASGETRQLDLTGLFPTETREGLAVIAGEGELTAALEAGKSLLVCDSATDEELLALARTAEPCPNLLYAGSAGLARAIASLYPNATTTEPLAAAQRVLVIAGTLHRVTQMQLAQLHSAAFPPDRAQVLRADKIPSDLVEDGRASAGKSAFSSGELAAMRATVKTEILRAVETFAPDALILTGGDTAQVAGEALGADSISLRGELADGIPWGILQGGHAHGRVAITKSGGFGTATALSDLVQSLVGAA